MAPVKVLITGVSGLVGSAAYLHLSQWPERYELYGLGRRRELSEGHSTPIRSARMPLTAYS